ncbi:MAG: NAD(P)/FAD-dependent oxidoreductase [Betaproteobacteria bacterium]|nr:NAD(P)/FAD-dependent oxidoreductase [Betaproteobacteria bacterium]
MSYSTQSDQPLDAIIVGAGLSGMYQLHTLRDQLGLRVKVLEAADGVGGTWYHNRYPGARCDSESHSYMFYFSQELVQSWEWSERYPQQPEILRYMNHVADFLQLRPDLVFNTRVVAAEFDEPHNLWRITTASGQVWQAKYLITAVGCLSSANVPAIKGLDSFQGQWVHTSAWPHEGVDMRGKRVGRALMQETPNAHCFRIEPRSALEVTDEERQAIYQAAWDKGGLQFRATFNDLLRDKEANDTAAKFIKHKIQQVVHDPKVAALLSDIDHPFAAKRPPIDSHYFETFNRDNVQLVDIRSHPIECIDADGIQTTQAHYPLDTIVFATGFDAMTGSLLRMNISGRGGLALKDAWHAGPRTYLGLQVPGFPNMFTITGPGSPSVLCNLPPQIEQHVNWITDCIAYLQTHGIRQMEADAAASDDWVQQVNEAAHATLLPQVRHSWYLGANVPGKPRVFMPYAGGFARYRGICDEVAAQGYRGFHLIA